MLGQGRGPALPGGTRLLSGPAALKERSPTDLQLAQDAAVSSCTVGTKERESQPSPGDTDLQRCGVRSSRAPADVWTQISPLLFFFALILFLLVLHTSSPSSFLHAVFHLRTDSWKQLNTVSLFGSQGIRVRADADFGHSTKCLPQLECAVG